MSIHIDTHWLNPREQRSVLCLRELADLALQKIPTEDPSPKTLEAIGYFNPTIESCVIRCERMQRFAYGDMGICLGLPGLSLTGMLLHQLRSDPDAQRWYRALTKTPCRSFFAVTEPHQGTRAHQMHSTCRAHGDHYHLDAIKWYVGKAAVGDCGVVMTRDPMHPLGMHAVFLDQNLIAQNDHTPTLQRDTLPITILQAAHMGCLRIQNLTVPRDNVLGWRLNPMVRQQTLLRTFNLMRPTVGAMALGMARAILDHIEYAYPKRYQHPQAPWPALRATLKHATQHLARYAHAIDTSPDHLSLGSHAKMLGVHTLQNVTHQLSADPYPWLLEDAWLRKWYRDSWGLDFMEGITPVHYQNILSEAKRQSCMTPPA